METLRNYLESMFSRYPETPEALRAKAELWQMMEDKFSELTAEGKSENEAVGIVIAEFGDLDELAETLGIATMLQKTETPGPAKSIMPEGIPEPKAPDVNISEMFTDYSESSDTVTENETAWQSTDGTQDQNGAWWAWHNASGAAGADTGESIYKAISAVLSVYWPTVTCLYLCWSFLTFRWWITWIIWPLAAVVHSILKRVIMGDMRAGNGSVYKSRIIAAVLDSYWPCVVFVYLAFSFLTGTWAISWLIFIAAPFIRNLLKRSAMAEEEEKS